MLPGCAGAQPGEPRRICRRQVQSGLDVPDALRAAETLSEDVYERGIDIVDRGARIRQLDGDTAHSQVGRSGDHGLVTMCHRFLPVGLNRPQSSGRTQALRLPSEERSG